MEEKLSVCLFNAGESSKKCIGSIVNRPDYDKEKSEILVFSNDAEVLRTLNSEYSAVKIRMFRTENDSDILNLNATCQLAKNEIILFADSACIFKEGIIESLMTTLLSPNAPSFIADDGRNIFAAKAENIKKVGYMRSEMTDITGAFLELATRISFPKPGKVFRSEELFEVFVNHRAPEDDKRFITWEMSTIDSEEDTVIESVGAILSELTIYKNGRETEKVKTFQGSAPEGYVDLYKKYTGMTELCIRVEEAAMISPEQLKSASYDIDTAMEGQCKSLKDILGCKVRKTPRIAAQKGWSPIGN